MLLTLSASSTIIQDVEAICEAGHASMSYFYFDFRDVKKQHLNDLVLSLITQLSTHSGPRYDILSRYYEASNNGTQQPGNHV